MLHNFLLHTNCTMNLRAITPFYPFAKKIPLLLRSSIFSFLEGSAHFSGTDGGWIFTRKFIVRLVYILTILMAGTINANELLPNELLVTDFIQYRHLQGLPNAIKSEGNIYVWKEKGVYWETKKPFASGMFISKHGIFQVEDQGLKSVTNSKPDVTILNSIAILLEGNIDKQVPGFVVEHKGVTIELKAQHEAISKIISTIVIERKDGVIGCNNIKIYRANGDYDFITLNNHQVYPVEQIEQRLSQAQRMLFEYVG